MAIIDLDSGSIDGQAAQPAGQPILEPTRTPDRVIDLDTGGFIKPEVSQQRQLSQQGTVTDQTALEQPLSQFPEERKDTRAVQDLPELGSGGLLAGEDQAKVAAITPVLLTTFDPQEMANILQNQFPESIGIQFDPGGNIIAANNKTGARVVLNKPGISQIDVLQGLGIASVFTPAARAAAAVPAAAGLTARALAGGAAAGLTQAALEGIQSQVGGDLDAEEIALASALGGVAETVIPAIKAVRQARRGRVLDVGSREVAETVERIAPAREGQAAIKEVTGVEVPLFQAQQTLQPSTLLKQRLLPQLDAGAKKAAESLENQNKAVFDATAELINTIAPPEVIETGAKRFRTAAQTAVEAGMQRRSEAVKPLFDEAFKQGAQVDLLPVNALIDEALAGAPKTGKIFSNINKVKSLISGGVDAQGKQIPASLKELQKAKFEIDDMLEAFGENALGNTTKRDVAQIQRALVNQMEQASPAYKAANEEFKRLSPAVTELQDSIVGGISKLDDVSLKNISSRIFDVRQTDPSVVRKSRAIIENVDPGAWDDLMRVELQRRFGGIETLAEDLPGELVGNVPGQLRRAIFGNPGQRKTLLAGMTPDQRKNFVYLDDVLRRASSGRQAGSPTAPFGEVLDRLRGSAAVIRDAIFRPLETLQQTGERGLFDRNVSKLTDVLFDPKWEPKLKELRSADPLSPKAERIFSELITAAKAAPQASEAPQIEGKQ